MKTPILALFFGAAITAAITGHFWGGAAAFYAVLAYNAIVGITAFGVLIHILRGSPDVNGEKESDAGLSRRDPTNDSKQLTHDQDVIPHQTHRSIHPIARRG